MDNVVSEAERQELEAATQTPVVKGYEPSEGLKRTQKILESIELRRLELKRAVADKLRRGVEIDNEIRQATKDRSERIMVVEKIHETEVIDAGKLRDFRRNVIESAHDDLVEQRMTELAGRGDEISKLEHSLGQLRKQFDAEMGKLDPDRKVPA